MNSEHDRKNQVGAARRPSPFARIERLPPLMVVLYLALLAITIMFVMLVAAYVTTRYAATDTITLVGGAVAVAGLIGALNELVGMYSSALNDAMADIERHNPQLAGVLPRSYQLFGGELLKDLLKKISFPLVTEAQLQETLDNLSQAVTGS